jgi:AcrR family transcriptional regulator
MSLAHRNGFRDTSLADIAEAAHVPVGNLYYYFKTKEEAVVPVASLTAFQSLSFIPRRATGGYQSVKRFVRKLREVQSPEARAVIFTPAGEGSQVD